MSASAHTSDPTRDNLESQEIAIRPITDVTDLSQVEAIQRDVWDLPDDLMIVPIHMLKAVASFGGVLLGAYTHEGDVVGFVFGFLAVHHGLYSHHSHMMGVLPAYRDRGIGRLLKLAQREAVLAQGLDTISWTYDPLESRNAHLNINKLGAVCHTYVRDMYGEMVDGLNAGLPSDRFLVQWKLLSQRVIDRLTHAVAPPSFDRVLAAGAVVFDEVEEKARFTAHFSKDRRRRLHHCSGSHTSRLSGSARS